MIGNNVVGIIFSNMHDEHIRELTNVRTMGSVPFGGRYRAIDFPLSNMVNSGINKVGVVTKSNYQSLMDHLGSGKAWGLSRKRDGLFILPPFGFNNTLYHNRMEALSGIRNFLEHCKEEYVVLSDCHLIYSMNFGPVIEAHKEKNADITIVYKNSVMPEDTPDPVRFEVGRGRKITQVLVGSDTESKSNWSTGIIVMRKGFLLEMVRLSKEQGFSSFTRDVLQRGVSDYRIYGYKYDGYVGVIGSIKGYFEQNMALTNPKVRAELFRPEHPIYTKVRDDMPTRFGLGSRVVNSLVSDGCIIEGDVENCILSRGVKVDKGAVLRDCIIMQDNVIGEGARLSYVISDKGVIFKDGCSMNGVKMYPVYVSKGKIVQ